LKRRVLLAALVAAAILPYFLDLGGSSIWDANEAFYVETPREMAARGDYVSPTFNYEPRFNKPVLSYWIVAAFYRLFGVSVGVERLSIALGAMVIIATAFALARAAEDREPGGLDAGLAAALGLAVAPRLLMFARRIFIDVYVSMFMGLTLLCFVLSERYPARRRRYLLLMYVAVGLGVLTKGPVAAALPGLVFALYLLLYRELARARTMMLVPGAAIVAAIVLPWYAALYQRNGWTYISSFIFGENIARFAEGVGVQASRGFWYYLPVVFSDSAPLSLFLVAAAAAWLGDWRSGAAPAETVRIRALLWLWIATIVAFFTFSAAKQDLYIFPIVPAVAAIAGGWIARAVAGRAGANGLRASAALIGLLLGGLGAAALYVFHAAGTVYALDGVLFIGTVAAIGGAVVLGLAAVNRSPASLAALAITVIVLNWTFVLRVLPSFERYKPVPGLSAAIRARAAPDDEIVHYSASLPSMVYYLDRHIEVLLGERERFFTMLEGPRRVFAVLAAGDYEELKPSLPVPTCIVDQRPTVNMKLKAVLARDPLPQVLLITNRCE
jgi:4-amino-4-deoxy-L-arabinose transferase-like glycosyltransferase